MSHSDFHYDDEIPHILPATRDIKVLADLLDEAFRDPRGLTALEVSKWLVARGVRLGGPVERTEAPPETHE